MNDKRVERQLIAWSWRAELCDAMVLGAIESAPPDSIQQKETKVAKRFF